MTDSAKPGVDATALIEHYWAAAEARDWQRFGSLLSDDVVYELPQTRERVTGKEAYVRFNAEYPGDWHVTVVRILADGKGGASWTTFSGAAGDETGLCFFEIDAAGAITHITDFWPEPYEPPPGREHLVTRDAPPVA